MGERRQGDIGGRGMANVRLLGVLGLRSAVVLLVTHCGTGVGDSDESGLLVRAGFFLERWIEAARCDTLEGESKGDEVMMEM